MDKSKNGQKIELIDEDGKTWTFKNVISIDICLKSNWCNICYYDSNNEYHRPLHDIPKSIKFVKGEAMSMEEKNETINL